MTAYLDLARRLPPNYRKPKRYMSMTLAEIADEADRKGVERRLDERTIERHASAMRQFFRYGCEQGQITLAALERCSRSGAFTPRQGRASSATSWRPRNASRFSPPGPGRGRKRAGQGGGAAARRVVAGALGRADLGLRRQRDGAGRRDPAEVRRAVRERRKVRVAYSDASGRETVRVVWPLAMAYYVDATLVAAWCELRADLRHFRVERIAASEVLDEKYPDDRGRLLATWLALSKDSPQPSP